MTRGLHGFHPFTSWLYFIGLFLLSMLLLHPIYLATMLLGILLLINMQGQTSILRSYIKSYLWIGLFILILNPLLSHRGQHILFYLFDQPITLESIWYGITMMLSLWCILLVFISYNHVITARKFLFLFCRLFPKTALLCLMAVRFVPLLKRRLSEIHSVQKTRGIDPTDGPLWKRARDGMLILQVLLTMSLEEAIQTADSMKARGYGLFAQRSSYVPYRFRRGDYLFLTLMLLAFFYCFTGWILGHGSLIFYPGLEGIALTASEIPYYASLLLYLLLAIFIEGREGIGHPRV